MVLKGDHLYRQRQNGERANEDGDEDEGETMLPMAFRFSVPIAEAILELAGRFG